MDKNERQFEPAWEERKQTETVEMLLCSPRLSADGRGVIHFDAQSFPSLQHWRFGLIAKEGVSLVKLEELAAQIEELCEGSVAHFDYQPEGLELYETDKFGLAILAKE